MKDIIKMIYDGQNSPAEAIIPKDTDYWETAGKIGDEWRYFEKKYPEDKKRFDELDGLLLNLSYMHSYAHFEYAFKLGVLLMCSIFLDDGIMKEE